jgi:hypothetical protein
LLPSSSLSLFSLSSILHSSISPPSYFLIFATRRHGDK